MTASTDFAPMPDTAGFFGPYGGQLVPPHLKQAMDDINAAYAEITQRQDFQDELATVRCGLGLPIERDLSFRAEKRLSAYARDARLAGRIAA